MKKKILLYLVSLVVVAALFWWIKSGMFGSGGWHTRERPVQPIPVYTHKGMANLVVEVRSPTGVLEYVLRARQALPKGNGRYLLTEPSMQFYSAGHQTTIIASDMGDVYVDQIGGPMSSRIYPRKGKLFGHPTITMGPLHSFIPGVRRRQPGQMQIRFSRQVTFNYQQGVILSPGAVHLRSDQADFDGSGLTAQIDLQRKELTYLRIDKGMRLVVRHVYQNSNPAMDKASSAQPNRGGSGVGPTPTPVVPALASATGKTTTAAPPVVYRLDFIDHVEALIGPQTIQAHRFVVYFSNSGTGATPKTAPTTPPPTASPKTPATTHPATTQQATNDLYLTWTGPMIMRPQLPKTVHLQGPKDIFFEALGQAGHPVRMADDKTLLALAQELTYETQPQILQLIPATGGKVVLRNKQLGSAHCELVTFNRLTNRVLLFGPGRARLQPQSAKAGTRRRWRATWQKSIALKLAPASDLRHSGRTTLAVRRVILQGNAVVQNAGISIRGDELAAWLTAGGTPHQPQALQRMLAHGGVRVTSWNTTGQGVKTVASRMTCDELTIQSKTLPGQKSPEPHALLATGDVRLKLMEAAPTPGRAPTIYTIATPRLAAHIAPATAGAQPRGNVADATNHYTVTRFHANNGVRLSISTGGTPIVATATTMRGNRRTGIMVLTGGTPATPKNWATIVQQGNLIAGANLILHQKPQSINAHGPGRFILVRTKDAHGMAKPGVQILWRDSMNYDGTTHRAAFVGKVRAALLSRPDQQSRLACHQLTIRLARPSGGTSPQSTATGQLRLVDLHAVAAPQHQLSAMDASFNPRGLLQTRLYIQSNLLHYNAPLQRLTITGPGQMSLEDYRGESAAQRRAAKKAAPANGMNQPRGQSAFAWTRGLRYHGKTGVLSLRGRVRVVYKPLHPLQASILNKTGGNTGVKNHGAGGQARLILLDCQRLMARLTRPRPRKTSALELGMGGPMKLDFMQAQVAAMELMGVRLTADVLKFNAAQQQAVAVGLNGHEAVVSSTNGQAHGQAHKIIWNLSKGRAGLIFIEPRGTISTH